MQRYIEKYAVTSIVTLNCNGKYTVTPGVTFIIVPPAKKYSVTGIVTFLVTRDRVRYFCRHIFIYNVKCDGKSNGKSNGPSHASLKI